MSAAASVRYDIQGGVAFITLSRPERLNALDRPMMRVLAAPPSTPPPTPTCARSWSPAMAARSARAVM
ncbi:MAG: hypothetical protein IPN01_15110 [Deltaproteobacteria bacterium]|nr:hypothetical protein [Deltaproteobacteria bacterium]